MSLISVIIPVYNVEKYLQEAVYSVLNQTLKDIEIILINDGSTDSSGKICDEFRNKDSRIKVINQKNGGLSAARNAGLEIATGKYVTFLDSDDWLDKETYEKMMDLIVQENADMATFGFIREYKNHSEYTLVPKCRLVMKDGEAFRYVAYNDYFCIIVCNKIIRRELFRSIRFPIGKTSEDYRVTFELLDKCSKVVYDSYPYYHYRMRKGSIGHSERISYEPRDATKNMMNIVKNKYPQYFPYAVLCHWYGLIAVNQMFQYHSKLRNSTEHKLLLKEMNYLTKKYFKMLKDVNTSRKDYIKMYVLRYAHYAFPYILTLYSWTKSDKTTDGLFP